MGRSSNMLIPYYIIDKELSIVLHDFVAAKKIPSKRLAVAAAITEFVVQCADLAPEEVYARCIQSKYVFYQMKKEST